MNFEQNVKQLQENKTFYIKLPFNFFLFLKMILISILGLGEVIKSTNHITYVKMFKRFLVNIKERPYQISMAK